MAAGETDSSALTPKQQRAVRALLEHKSVGEAASSIGVGERTLFRWLTDPAFKLALSAAESDLLDAATPLSYKNTIGEPAGRDSAASARRG
jgi:hypothetical protein